MSNVSLEETPSEHRSSRNPVGRLPQGLWPTIHLLRRLVLIFLALTPSAALAQDMAGASLAVSTEGGDPRTLPLVDEFVDVKIDQGHADSEFLHTFQNETQQNVEGRYQIALGRIASATGFAYWNGERKIVGEIFEKEVAREVYETVTGTGRDPGLLEQSGEGTFSFRVAPISAGEKKRVSVKTSSWLAQVEDTLELQLPLSKTGKGSRVLIQDDRKLKKIWSPTHALSVEDLADGARITVGAPQHPGDRLVVRYQVQEDDFALSTAYHQSRGSDGYLTVSVAAPHLRAQTAEPRDVTLVIDRSGSMSGAPLAAALSASAGVIQRLKEDDAVNVIAFDDGAEALFERPLPVRGARKRALQFVAGITTGGGTDLAAALDSAIEAQGSAGRSQFVLFLTDGQSSAAAALQAAQKAPPALRLYTVGIGAGVDRALLSRLARDNRGRFTFVADEANLEHDVEQLDASITAPVLSDVELEVLGARSHHVYPRRSPDLFQKDQLVWSLRISPAEAEEARVVLKATHQGKTVRRERRIELRDTHRPWVGRHFAQARVDDLLEQIALSGETAELRTETVELALAYDLVTQYTSFLAIPESEVSDRVRGTLEQERARRAQVLAKHRDAAQLSRSLMPPGDPLLSVRAPADAQGVTAVFPFGLTLDLSYDAHSERWEGRFLVPHDAADAVYQVQIFVTDRLGQLSQTSTRYEIDSRAPAFEARFTEDAGGGVLVVEADEPLREVRVRRIDARTKVPLVAAGIPCPSGQCNLQKESKTRFSEHLSLPPGQHELRIVVTDEARNESVRTITVVVEDGGC